MFACVSKRKNLLVIFSRTKEPGKVQIDIEVLKFCIVQNQKSNHPPRGGLGHNRQNYIH
jgi:hypothetical protein